MQLNFSADIIAIAGPVKAKSLRAGASPAEAAMYGIEGLGYRLLLTLPEDLRRGLFAESTLSGNCRFVLAGLDSLDSRGALDHYVQELPCQTGLDWSECRACLQTLARLDGIEYTEAGVRLKVKPLAEPPT
jgi:hypothetical protein